MKGYGKKDVWGKNINLGDCVIRIEIVHWTLDYPIDFDGYGTECDINGKHHNYNIYIYAYNDSRLMVDILQNKAAIPFHGGETYRLHSTHERGKTICAGCDFGHYLDELAAVAPIDGMPPGEVVRNANEIQDYIIKTYGNHDG